MDGVGGGGVGREGKRPIVRLFGGQSKRRSRGVGERRPPVVLEPDVYECRGGLVCVVQERYQQLWTDAVLQVPPTTYHKTDTTRAWAHWQACQSVSMPDGWMDGPACRLSSVRLWCVCDVCESGV